MPAALGVPRRQFADVLLIRRSLWQLLESRGDSLRIFYYWGKRAEGSAPTPRGGGKGTHGNLSPSGGIYCGEASCGVLVLTPHGGGTVPYGSRRSNEAYGRLD